MSSSCASTPPFAASASSTRQLRFALQGVPALVPPASSQSQAALALNAAVARAVANSAALTQSEGTNSFTRRRLEHHIGEAFVRLFELANAAGTDVGDARFPAGDCALFQCGDAFVTLPLPSTDDTPEPPSTNRGADTAERLHVDSGPEPGDSLSSAPPSALDTSPQRVMGHHQQRTPVEDPLVDVLAASAFRSPMNDAAAAALAKLSIRDIPTVQSSSASPVASSLQANFVFTPPAASVLHERQRGDTGRTQVGHDTPASILKRNKSPVNSPERVSPSDSSGIVVPDSARSGRDKHASFRDKLVERVDEVPLAHQASDASNDGAARSTPDRYDFRRPPPFAGRTPPKTKGAALSHTSPPALRQLADNGHGPSGGAHSRTSSAKLQTPCSPDGQPLFGIMDADSAAMMVSDDEFLGTLNAVNVTSIHSTSASPCGTRLLPPQFRRGQTTPKPASTPALATMSEVGAMAGAGSGGASAAAAGAAEARQVYHGSREDIVAMMGSPDLQDADEDETQGPHQFPQPGSHEEFGASLQSEAVMDTLVLPPPAGNAVPKVVVDGP
eukprot:CAMPEP_0174845406 /NCGR_PEP_ID=MMETSP1114-20130205/11705_1 /TAXON_ID=312471 /ORGANISM="Neobodo designis, Strain CCAP 1951/1" /LENGTH=558 /DNA_ID=CAMNT_0016079651 /DNA_START=31 /DNA_END=1703 /DNA_ORIENTATION=+